VIRTARIASLTRRSPTDAGLERGADRAPSTCGRTSTATSMKIAIDDRALDGIAATLRTRRQEFLISISVLGSLL
jgi:hypothetical protein